MRKKSRIVVPRSQSGLFELGIEIIRASRHKVTESRRGILLAVLERSEPFSVYDLAAELEHLPREGQCDLATVYRTLSNFEKLGIVRKSEFASDSVKFECALRDNQGAMATVFCRGCGEKRLLDKTWLEDLSARIEDEGFFELRHKVIFSGLCASCTRRRGLR